MYMVRGLAYFRHQTLDIGDLGAVGGNRDGDGVRPFGWKSIESLTGGFACRGLAGCDVDFGTAGLEKTGKRKLGFSKPTNNKCPFMRRGERRREKRQ